MIRYLTAEELLVIHALVIDETTGSHGVRDPGLLESIAHRPQAQFGGQDVHNDLFAKAAALGEDIVNYHVFVDGNKRTGFVAVARFLAMNQYSLEVTQEAAEVTMIGVAKKEIDCDKLRTWIQKFAQHIERGKA